MKEQNNKDIEQSEEMKNKLENLIVMPQKQTITREDIDLLFNGLVSLVKKKMYEDAKTNYMDLIRMSCKKQAKLQKEVDELKKINKQLKNRLLCNTIAQG